VDTLDDLRATPDPIPLAALAVDGRVELRARGEPLEPEPEPEPLEPEPLERSSHRFVYAYGECRLHVFALGAVVLVGSAALDEAFLAFVQRCTGRTALVETVDRYHLIVDAETGRPQVQWDRILVPRLDDEVIDAVALLLARSAGLERYERGAEPLLEQGLILARTFAGHGRPPRVPGPTIRRIASLAVARLELARWFVHLDRPEPAWEDPVVDRLYDVLGDHLELVGRHEALMHRMASLERSLSMIVSVWESRRSRFLEWAIVWLIVVEIVLAFVHG
jgi:uncharacterized Rmd1/YagE family protein